MTEENDDLEINNLPNRLTIMRVLLVPIVVGLLYMTTTDVVWFVNNQNGLYWVSGWIFTFASITDFLDGYIARKRNISTVFGSFLDPVADKFLVVSSLIMLVYLRRVDVIIVIILVLREMYMTSLRLLALTEGINVPVSPTGKWKTATQMVAIPFLMAYQTFWIFPLDHIGTILIYISAALSLLSAFVYSLNVVVKMKEVRKIKKQKLKEEKMLRQSKNETK
ncbi:MAG: CDP-diacylglycerol--glycerol-3-phosphate 3-phosphatidyltransferase [Bacteriovoracaceae bacterium]|nr:CDP-diacylglycerol--glycerol-3-phosphate 3-phosphatidyltransferase [Bacteriovoracaceae bacterium]